ncbi:MAG: class I adenylate-forming enzyme family protein, partial [Firmicutes bacterium]|nr:class I adenylate-forming enzyme family protein [Bacillota bacterium]
ANQIANALSDMAIKSGDRVALLLPNGLEFAELYFGLAKAGAVAVPLSWRWTPSALRQAVTHSGAALVLVDREFAPLLDGVEPYSCPVHWTGSDSEWERRVRASSSDEPTAASVAEEAPIVLAYTSGTTGTPKGALRTHASHMAIALTMVAEMRIAREWTGFAMLPMYHVNSMWFVTLTVAIGATCVISSNRTFHPERILQEVTDNRVGFGMFVPSILTYMVEAAETGRWPCPDLRVLMTSSAPLDRRLRDRILAAFDKAELYDIYGATEYGAATVFQHAPGTEMGSVGYPVMGHDVSIRDEQGNVLPVGEPGHVYFRGASLMSGYWRLERARFAGWSEDGFLTVGDMGYVRKDGRLILVDRAADRMIVRGENVFPSDVEAALVSHPAVALAAVFGVPDRRRGEAIVALVQPRPGHTVSVEELQKRCRDQLADYQWPRHVEVVAQLPLGPAGKVVRAEARRDWQAAHPEREDADES